MVAGVGRRPLAQVLRNLLAGHPPTTGMTRCHESEPLELCPLGWSFFSEMLTPPFLTMLNSAR